MNKQRSQFTYRTQGITKANAIKYRYMHDVIFTKYLEYEAYFKMKSYTYYKLWVFKPILIHRKIEIDKANRRKSENN